MLRQGHVLKMRVDAVEMGIALDCIQQWLAAPGSRYICAANVHMCMEVWDSPAYRAAVNGADLVVPDSRPMKWALWWLGFSSVSQVRGANFLLALCRLAERQGNRVGLYGGSREGVQAFSRYVRHTFPDLKLVCTIAPPFQTIGTAGESPYLLELKQAMPELLLVGLGCPRQEYWMAQHKDSCSDIVMVGLGAAFDFLSGRIRSAPRWMQKAGLEWLFRLACDPRRLWKRYLKHNPRFIWHFSRQLWAARRG